MGNIKIILENNKQMPPTTSVHQKESLLEYDKDLYFLVISLTTRALLNNYTHNNGM